MRGAPRGASDVIDGVQVSVLQGLVEGLSVCDNRTVENEESAQGAVGGAQLPESARALWAFMRPRQ